MPIHRRPYADVEDIALSDGSQPEGPYHSGSSEVALKAIKAQLAQIRQPSVERFLRESTSGEDSTQAWLTADLKDIAVLDKLSGLSLLLSISWLQSNPTYHVGSDIGNRRIRLFVLGMLKEPTVAANIAHWVDHELNGPHSSVRENWSREKEFVVETNEDRTAVMVVDYRMNGATDYIAFPRRKLLEFSHSPTNIVTKFRSLQHWVATTLSQAAGFTGDEPSRRWLSKKPWIPLASPNRWRITKQTSEALHIKDERNGVVYGLPQYLCEDPYFNLVYWMRHQCWNFHGPSTVEEIYFDSSGNQLGNHFDDL